MPCQFKYPGNPSPFNLITLIILIPFTAMIQKNQNTFGVADFNFVNGVLNT